jgi:hypothetical protein
MSMRRGSQPAAPDRTALTSGLSGLALATTSALVRALAGGVSRPVWAAVALGLVTLVGFGLGVLAIWSAIKAWLRDGALSVAGRWGAALGLAAMLFVVATGPCGQQSCPG